MVVVHGCAGAGSREVQHEADLLDEVERSQTGLSCLSVLDVLLLFLDLHCSN